MNIITLKKITSSIQFILLLFFIVLFANCNQTISPGKLNSQAQDSIDYYLDRVNDKTLSTEERKDFAWKVYSLTPKIEDSLKARYVYDLGIHFNKVYDYENYLNFTHKAIKVAKKHKNIKIIADSKFNLAYYYFVKNYVPDSAYYYFGKAKNNYEELNDSLKIGKCILYIGNIQGIKNDLIKARSSIKSSMVYFKALNNHFYMSSVHKAFGNIDSEIGNLDSAIENYNKAIEYSLHSNNHKPIPAIYNNIGVIFMSQKKYNDAIDYYSCALSHNDSLLIKDPELYTLYLSNLAVAKFKSGDDKNIPSTYFKALKIRNSIDDKTGVLYSMLDLAEYHEFKKNIDSTKFYAYKAKEIAENIKFPSKLLNSLMILSRIESKEKSDELMRLHAKIQDSLKSNEINTAQGILNEMNSELDEAKLKNNRVISQKNYLTILSLLLLVLLSTFLIYHFKRQKIYKKRLHALLNQETIITQNITIQKKELNIDENIIQYILKSLQKFEVNNQYLGKGITLTSLSKNLNTNSNYLSKIINVYKGKNFTNYVNELKINYIVKELQEDEKLRLYTIKTISDEIGFNNTQSFSKAFYKKTGIYPSFFISQINKLQNDK